MAQETESRLQELIRLRQERGLTDAENAELVRLVQEAETRYLTGATAQLQHRREALDAQNRALDALAKRKESLATRLRDFLTATQAERRQIDREVAAVLAERNVLQTHE